MSLYCIFSNESADRKIAERQWLYRARTTISIHSKFIVQSVSHRAFTKCHKEGLHLFSDLAPPSIHRKPSQGVSFSMQSPDLPSSWAIMCETHLTDLEMPQTWWKQAQIPPGWNSPLIVMLGRGGGGEWNHLFLTRWNRLNWVEN